VLVGFVGFIDWLVVFRHCLYICCVTVAAGLGREVRKSDIVTIREETDMLASPAASPLIPNGLNARFAWYCTSRFFYQGAFELRNIDSMQFQLVLDEYNEECLR
jgi:hypothetical protein